MNDTPAETPATPPEKPLPVYRLEPAQRYAHIVRRMSERGGLTWTADQVAHRELGPAGVDEERRTTGRIPFLPGT